jgi:hypothetical protein
MRTPIMRMIIKKKAGIQIGDNTHTHDHAITLVSLRPTKRTVNNPVKPMPPEEEEEESLMIQNDGTAGVLGAA